MLIRLYHYPPRSLILQIDDGFGEIAPLPGFSSETFDQAKEELLRILPDFSSATLPSVRWGIACAQKKLCPVHLPLAALNTPKAGFTTLKLKLGHLPLDQAISLVKQHYRRYQLRLDCNRAWTLSQALEFASHFKPTDFAYLEEPVQTFAELVRFSEMSQFPIALDESIHSNWALIPSLKAIVVKPTVVGHIPKIPPHLDLILSSSYETGLGLLHIARAAQELQLPHPIGLDTVKDDLLITPISTAAGFFSWSGIPSTRQLRKTMSHCPLKEAARDAPDHLAILSQGVSLTFSELDKYVDSLSPPPLIVKEISPLPLIASFFAAWRRHSSLFSVNPRIPQIPELKEAPPQSLLLFTSGSTGKPKIAVLSLAALLANAKGAIPSLDLRPADQWRLSLPLYHVGGIGILLRCILARATIVLDDSPHITHLSYVPTHLYRATPVYKKLRCLLLGGAPVSSYPRHLPVYTTYGLTEMGSMVSLNGQILPNRELRLAPDGEIFVRGPCLFQGYLGEEPPTDWFATGDLATFHNGLSIIGRKDWMFISGGENIQPEEIERELLSLPEVVEAVVLPKEDPEFGKRPVAFVRAQSHFDLKRMQHALRDRLPKYKIPVALYLVDELPKNDFKINRFILSQTVNNQLIKNTAGQKK